MPEVSISGDGPVISVSPTETGVDVTVSPVSGVGVTVSPVGVVDVVITPTSPPSVVVVPPDTVTLNVSPLDGIDVDVSPLDGIVVAPPSVGVTDHGDLTGLGDNDHPQYQEVAEKGQPDGYAELGPAGLVPMSQLATGVPNGTQFVRDDGSLATPAGSGGVTDHGALDAPSLLDDDHPQYALTDGTRGDFEVADAVADHVLAPDPHADRSYSDGLIVTHEGAADPHPDYQLESEKGVANGYAELGAGGLVPMDQLATGIPNGTQFVRDDGTLDVPDGVTDHPTLTDRDTADSHPAAAISVVASGFDGNLTTDDDTVQEVAQKLDDLILGESDDAWAEIDQTSNVTDFNGTSVSLGTGGSLTMRWVRIGRYVRGTLIGIIADDNTLETYHPTSGFAMGGLAIPAADLPYLPRDVQPNTAHASNFGYIGVPATHLGYTGPSDEMDPHTHATGGHGNLDIFGVPADTPIGSPSSNDVHTHPVTSYGGWPGTPAWTTAPADSGPLGTDPHTHDYTGDGYIITIGPIFTDFSGAGAPPLMTFVHFSPEPSNGLFDNLFKVQGTGYDAPTTQYTPNISGRAFTLNTSFEYEAASAA